jgi:hypothetical protein
MKVKFLTSLIFILAFTFWPLTIANAEPNGLKVQVYTYDPVSTPEMQPYTLCESAWTSVANIDVDWGGDVVAGCQSDFVLVHYSGYLTSDRSGTFNFTDWSDDGFYMSLDGETVISAWSLKGCSPASGQFDLIEGQSVKFDAWFYEYGGGACNHLFWDDGVIPASAFSQDVSVPIEPPVIPEPPVVIVPTPEPTIPVVIPEPVVPEPVVPEPVVPEPVVPEPEPVEPVVPVIPDVPVIEPVTPDKPVIVLEPIPTPETTPEPVIEPLEPDLPIIDPIPPIVLSPAEEHQQLLDTLLEQAQADDIQVPENIASIPVFGASIVALTDAINFMGNVGADMSPEVRATAKKEVVAAVVLTQISQFATSTTQVSASSSASGSGSKTRRNKE